jgi:hypothetical protein
VRAFYEAESYCQVYTAFGARGAPYSAKLFFVLFVYFVDQCFFSSIKTVVQYSDNAVSVHQHKSDEGG